MSLPVSKHGSRRISETYQYESDTPKTMSYIVVSTSVDRDGGVWRCSLWPTLGGLVLRAIETLRLPRFAFLIGTPARGLSVPYAA